MVRGIILRSVGQKQSGLELTKDLDQQTARRKIVDQGAIRNFRREHAGPEQRGTGEHLFSATPGYIGRASTRQAFIAAAQDANGDSGTVLFGSGERAGA